MEDKKDSFIICCNIAESVLEEFNRKHYNGKLYFQEFNQDGSVNINKTPKGEELFEIIYKNCRNQLDKQDE